MVVVVTVVIMTMGLLALSRGLIGILDRQGNAMGSIQHSLTP